MTDPQIAIMMLAIFILTIFLGFPVAFTLMAVAVIFGYYAYFDADRQWRSYDRAVEKSENATPEMIQAGEVPGMLELTGEWFGGFLNNRIFDLFVNQTYSVMSNDVLTAIPLFLFMGYIVERANIVTRLFDTLYVTAKRLPGAMAVAALATCALFATATGIIGAVVTLMGMLALPSMLRANYDTSFAAGVICAGGCLGILIPPSIMLIVYAATSNVSIVQLYAGALFPGFLLAGLYMVYVVGRAALNPKLAPKPPADETDELTAVDVIVKLITSFFPLAILILAVLGAILFGLATPSEAASLGALGGLLLAIAYRSLTWDRLRESVYLTMKTSAMVCWMFVGSWTFASVFSWLGGEALIEEFVLGLDLTPIQFLIMAQVIIFILGWPLEWSEIIIIFVPIFLPLLPFFEIDPLFFGILIALNLQTSFLTPPMAMAAYYLKGVAPPGVELAQIFKGVMPFLVLILIAMVMVYNFPGIYLWLPNAIYG
ncbi:MAG: TRAP transporter large permease subunit [Pseudomonadota bacterium]